MAPAAEEDTMTRFDHVTRTFATLLSRRTLAGVLGLGAISLPSLADAKKKRNKKKRKIKRNSFGCVNVGNVCKNSGQCCSGICQGKKSKKKCQAHNTSTCQPGQSICGPNPAGCTTDTGAPGGCTRTTGSAGYCEASGDCFVCQKDADCVPFCGAGAACIVCPPCASEGTQTACAGDSLGSCTFPP
jgi:hypothetical protein